MQVQLYILSCRLYQANDLLQRFNAEAVSEQWLNEECRLEAIAFEGSQRFRQRIVAATGSPIYVSGKRLWERAVEVVSSVAPDLDVECEKHLHCRPVSPVSSRTPLIRIEWLNNAPSPGTYRRSHPIGRDSAARCNTYSFFGRMIS